jgi:hypothetical protein
MKTNRPIIAFFSLSLLLFVFPSRAADIVATNSGNWGDPTIWSTGTVPGTNDDADVESPFTVTVDTNATVQYIYGTGTVTLSSGAILWVLGDVNGAYGAQQLATLDATAAGSTVIYSGNSFWAKRTDYYNLVFSNTVVTNQIDFFNGAIPGYAAVPMNIAGDMTVIGKIKVQEGADISIGGNLLLTTNAQWDCSSFNFTVKSNVTLGAGALLLDLDGASGANDMEGNVTVSASAIGWNVSDVTQWLVGGSLTNNGLIVGKGYGCITFEGTGVIAGKPFTIPTFTNNGTYMIGTTITLSTNTPTLNGTLVFDLAQTNEIILKAGTNWIWYSGNLDVINSGPAPTAGKHYTFFSATNYGGAFTSTTFPPLSGGLSWIDNLATSGSIAVSGAVAAPTLTLSKNGGLLTLSWDSTTFPGFSVKAQTNNSGLGSVWYSTGSGTTSPFVVPADPNNKAVFFRLSNP